VGTWRGSVSKTSKLQHPISRETSNSNHRAFKFLFFLRMIEFGVFPQREVDVLWMLELGFGVFPRGEFEMPGPSP
jgi:hypothetical protein